jgi:hypothetical protein
LSLAFSTLVIALFALMPGLFFEHFLYAGKMSRVRASTPTLTDLAVSVGLSIPVHLFTLWFLEVFNLLRVPVDYSVFLQALTGQFGDKGQGLAPLGESLRDHHLLIALYLLATAFVGFMLGQMTQYLALTSMFFDRLLPFRNRWFSTFFLYSGQKVSFCEAFVLTKLAAQNRPLLYSGTVNDFEAGPGGELLEIRLSSPRRAFLKPSPESLEGTAITAITTAVPEMRPDVEWLPLEQKVLVLPGDQISNLSLAYQYAWSPLVILIRVKLTLLAGPTSTATVNLLVESPWWRRLILRWLPTPEKFFVVSRQGTVAAQARVDGYNFTLTAEGSLANDVDFQVVGAWEGIVDARGDKTGNFLFWFDQKLRKRWSRWIQKRANSWH